MILSAAVVAAACDSLPALPDTSGFAADLTSFAQLPPAEHAGRIAAAARLAAPWIDGLDVRDHEVKRSLTGTLMAQCRVRWQARSNDYLAQRSSDIISEGISELSAALTRDPTHATARVALGMLLLMSGESRAAVNHLCRALVVLDDDSAVVPATGERKYLLDTAAWLVAMTYRDLGLWGQAEAMVPPGVQPPVSGQWALLHGLCLAGSGRTADAIAWAAQMPGIEYQHSSSLGSIPRPGAFANDWIRSQALLAAGDPVGARHALGETDGRKYHTLPFGEHYWQDAGLACELLGDAAAATYYERAQGRTPLWFARRSDGATLGPLVLGFPGKGIPFFTNARQGFMGGSPFGYIAQQMNLMAQAPDSLAEGAARIRALDMCEALLRRQIRPDVVHALRARVHLAAGCPELALPDLEFAHAAFAARGLVDAGTSLLLGQEETVAGNLERACVLLAEATAAAPDNALAWRQLGVARAEAREFGPAREAMDRALTLDPASADGWYNRGLLMYHTGDLAGALADLEKAWTLEPGNVHVQTLLQTLDRVRRQKKALSGGR